MNNHDECFLKGDALYEDGKLEQALTMFLEGAQGGDTSCMTRIAAMYTSGEGMDCCDYDEALYWEQRAVDEGDDTALVNLAITYRIKGDMKNYRASCERALASGDGSAAIELAKLYLATDRPEQGKQYLEIAVSASGMSEADVEESSQLLSEI